MTPAEAAKRIDRFAKSLDRGTVLRDAVVGAVRGAGRGIRSGFRRSGIGQGIWGARRIGARPPLVVKTFTRDVGGDLVAGFEMRGMTQLVEIGGRTEAHLIRPRAGRFLVWESSGGPIFARQVRHPGAAVRPHGIAERGLRQAGPKIRESIDSAITQLKRLIVDRGQGA